MPRGAVGESSKLKSVVTLSYQLPKAIEAKLVRDAEARSVRWRQRHGEGLFSPDATSYAYENDRLRA